jgi:hypothetical protein
MLTPLTVAASVLVPNQGWMIFGGFGSSLLTTQKLQATSGSWTAGPDLYNNENDYEHCGVQVHKPLLNILHLNKLLIILSAHVDIWPGFSIAKDM